MYSTDTKQKRITWYETLLEPSIIHSRKEIVLLHAHKKGQDSNMHNTDSDEMSNSTFYIQ